MGMKQFYFLTLVILFCFSLAACDENISIEGIEEPPGLSRERVAEALNLVETFVPGCKTIDASMAAMPVSPMEIRNRPAVDCGGTLHIDRGHNGSNGYAIVFEEFCFLDEDGTGEIVLNGVIKGSEDASAGEFGPTMHGSNFSTEGDLVMKIAGESFSFRVEDLSVAYGVPDIGAPGTPSKAMPDTLTVRRVDIDLEDKDVSLSVRNIKAERYRSDNDNVLEILSGTFHFGPDHVDISTFRPLVMDESGNFMSGIVRLDGADGNVVEILPVSRSRILEVKSNEEKLDRDLDCSGSVTMLLWLLGYGEKDADVS
jgi:hypothetical protein